MKKLVLISIACCALQIGVRWAGGCSVPVFRYALERWKPDPYKGIFMHRGKITHQDQALLRQLEDAALNSETPLNLRIRPVDVETFSEEKLKGILKGSIPAKLPVLAVWYPEQMGKTAPLWTIPLIEANVKALTASPKRTELAERLIGGESITWVFVPSGDAAKDDQARELIRKESDLAAASLAKMQFFTTAGNREKALTYRFSLLTVLRSDLQERFLLDMLMKSESDLQEHTGEPMVFPVYGRGRSLGCLFGEYLSQRKLRDVISFLAASCSCEVKALNPGLDLLIPAQWDRVLLGALYADDDEPLPELTGVMPGESAAPKAGPLARPAESRKTGGIVKIAAIVLGSLLIVVVFAGFAITAKTRRAQGISKRS